MESMCGGVAVFDYDNDGWMDIFLVNGRRSKTCKPANAIPASSIAIITMAPLLT